MTTFGAGRGDKNGSDAFESYFASVATFSGSRRLLADAASVKSDYENVWYGLSEAERSQILDEAVIRPEAVLKYSGEQTQKLPFEATQFFPRLKHPTGQKLMEDAQGSQGEDLDSASSSGCTYTYHDEHSAPFSWRTRSQQDLPFESGRPEQALVAEAMAEGLEVLETSPSQVLTRSVNYIRHSRGNPCFAKPVEIPLVPSIPKPEKTANPVNHGVPPEQINNFVYESSPNRLVLDFGEIQLDETHNPVESLSPSPRTSTPESTKSSRSLLSKVKKTFVTASTSTLRVRRKSAASSDPSNESNNGIVVTKNVRNRRLSQPEGKTAANPVPTSKVVKPSVAPPPPPTSVPAAGSSEENKDTAWSRSKRPPPPPARTTSKKENGHKECDFGVKPEALEAAEDNGVESSGNKRDLEDLDEFRIDLTTENVPKTGFDFLDNW